MNKAVLLALAAALAVVLAGCQTGQLEPTAELMPVGQHSGRKLTQREAACANAANRVAASQANAAALGSVLSLAGGFGGLGSHAGMIAGQAASIGGSVIQAQAAGQAQAAMAECYD